MKIVSVHVPRTGGFSLLFQLKDAFGERMAFDYARDAFNPGEVLTPGAEKGPLPFPEDKDIIHGHFRPDSYEGADTLITFLRYPPDAVNGLYNFLDVPEKPTLLEFAARPEIRWMLTQQYFGDFAMERFNFIGCFEQRARDLDRLGRILRIAFDPDRHHHRNLKASELAEHDALAELLADDIAFYRAYCFVS